MNLNLYSYFSEGHQIGFKQGFIYSLKLLRILKHNKIAHDLVKLNKKRKNVKRI
jgi:hypothetical protein